MREILFRGKRTDNDKWITGMLARYNPKFDTANIVNEFETLVPVITETIGQYTGLTDKNGTKIFEGDIIESRASENKEDWKKWFVLFQDGSFCFEREKTKKRKHKYEQNLLCADEIELYGLVVCGNIHDTPELLKKEM